MRAYADAYLSEVVESQGKLYDFYALKFPEKDTEDFIQIYMKSKTRKSIDEAKAYVATMDAQELWRYFFSTEKYEGKQGIALEGFMPDWIGEFYAYYQWYYNMPSSEIVDWIRVRFIEIADFGLHVLVFEVAVMEVGEI